MRKIANILAEKTSINDSIYNIVSEKENLIEGIPTLVIGWEFTKRMFPNANIIDWQIDDHTYWTFGNRERRSTYEDRIARFGEIAINFAKKSVKYEFFSILTATAEDKENFISIVSTAEKVNIYAYNGMCYMYIPEIKKTYGIYLKDLEYIGKDIKSFLRSLYKSGNASQVLCEGDEEKSVRYLFKNCNYILPYMLSS